MPVHPACVGISCRTPLNELTSSHFERQITTHGVSEYTSLEMNTDTDAVDDQDGMDVFALASQSEHTPVPCIS